MRRARIQVKPNIGGRKSAPVKNESAPTNIRNETQAKEKGEPSKADSVEKNKESDAVSAEPCTPNYNKTDPSSSAPPGIQETSAPGTPTTTSLIKDASTDVDSNAVAQPKESEPKNVEPKPSAPVRRSKIKPTVKLKPRITPAKVASSSSHTDTPDSGSKSGGLVSQSGNAATVTPEIVKENKLASEPEESPLSEKLPSKSNTKDKLYDAPLPALVSTISPGTVDVKDKTTVCVIKKEKYVDSDIGTKDKTTICIVPKDKTSERAATIVTQESAQSNVTSHDPSTTITKVVPGRRARMIKPKPNLLETTKHRNRSASMSASDAEEDPTKKQIPTGNRIDSTSTEDPSTVHVVVTKAEDLEGEDGTSETKDDDSPKKSYFQMKAEKEKRRVDYKPPRKMELLSEPVNRMTMKVSDLIYSNPSGNRMKSSILEEERKKKKREEKNKKGSDNASVLGSPDGSRSVVGSPDRQSVQSVAGSPHNQTIKSGLGSPDRQSTASVLGSPSAAAVDTPGEKEAEEEPLMVPQVKIGADGQIILNEESLTVEQHKSPLIEDGDGDVVEEFGNATYDPQCYYKKCVKSRPWTWRETKKFYLALSVVGTDFSLMTQLFKNRTRADIKKKFKKEEKSNRWLVDKALKDTKSYDISLFDQLSGSEEERKEEEEKKAKIKKEKAEKRRVKQTIKESKESFLDTCAKEETSKPKPTRKRRRFKTYYSGSSDSEDNGTKKTQIKPKKEKKTKTVKKEEDEKKNTKEKKKRQRTKKAKEPGTPGVGNKPKIHHPAVCNISNVSPGQLLLVSEDPNNSQTPDGKGEKMIHMYMISSEPEAADVNTPSPGPFVPVPHNRVRHNSIKEAMDVQDSDANPYSNYLAGKLTGIVPQTPRNRNSSQSSSGKKTPKHMKFKQKQEEQKQIMFDLTALGRDSVSSDVSGNYLELSNLSLLQQTASNSQAPSTSFQSTSDTLASNVMGNEPTIPRTEQDVPRIESNINFPEIVSIVKLPANSTAASETNNLNISGVGLNQSFEPNMDMNLNVNQMGSIREFLQGVDNSNITSVTPNINLSVKVEKDNFNVKQETENEVTQPREQSSENTLSTQFQRTNAPNNASVSFEDRMQSPPAARRLVNADLTQMTPQARMVNAGAQISAGNRPTVVTTASVCLVPSGAQFVTNASICLVQPTFVSASQAGNATQELSQNPKSNVVTALGPDGNLVQITAVSKTDVGQSSTGHQSGFKSPPLDSTAKRLPGKFSHLSPYQFQLQPVQTVATPLLSNKTIYSTYSRATNVSQSPRLSIQSTPGQYIPKFQPTPETSVRDSDSNTGNVQQSSVILSPSEYTSIKTKTAQSTSRAKVSPTPDVKTRLPQATITSSIPGVSTRFPQATFKATPPGNMPGTEATKHGNQTRLRAATFAAESDDDDLSRDESDDDMANVTAPPDDWLDETKQPQESKDGVQTIKIRILKSTEKPPDQQDQSGGEINLFVG